MFSGELASRSHLSGDMRKWQRVIPPLEMTAALPPPSPPPLSFPSPFLAATSNAALWLLLNSQGGNIQGEVSGFPLKPGLATAACACLSVGQAPGFSCLMVGRCGEGRQGTQLTADALTLTQTLSGGGKAWGEESLLGSLIFFLLKNYSKSIMLKKLDNYFDSALFLRGEVKKTENKDAGLPV